MDKRDIKYLEPRKTILEQIRSALFKITLFLIIVPTIFLFVIPGFMSLCFGKDLETVDDSSLALEDINIPDEENAFFDLEKIQEVYRGKDRTNSTFFKYLSGEEWDEEEVLEILELNKKELRYFDNAAEKDKFLLPHLSKPEEGFDTVYSFSGIRMISQVAAVRALNSLKISNPEQAFKEALNIIKVGRLMMNAQTNTIGYLVGIDVQKTGIDVMEKIINQTNVSIYRFQYYYDFLKGTETEINISPLKMLYLEKRVQLERIINEEGEMSGYEGIMSYILKNDFYFQPKNTLDIFNQRYQRLISYWQEDCSVEIFNEDPTVLMESLVSFPRMYFTKNMVGKLYANNSYVALNNIRNKYCQNKVSLSGLELMLELKAHYLRNGELPELLDDLSITYDDVNKQDAFSGLDFEYNKEEMTLKSVGRDHKLGTEDDIVFDLNFGQKVDEEVKTDVNN